MSDQKKLEDVCRVLTSILVSKNPPIHIPLAELIEDYYDLEDQDIPYQDLGFSTLVDLIKTIPEVDVLTSDSIYYLNFYGKDSTRHISDLVAKQKRKTQSRPRRTVPGMNSLRESSSSLFIDPKVTSHMFDIVCNHPHGILQGGLYMKLLAEWPFFTVTLSQYSEHLKLLDAQVVIIDDMIYPKFSPHIPGEFSVLTFDWASEDYKLIRSKSVPPKSGTIHGDSNGYDDKYEVKNIGNGDSRENGGKIVEQVPSYGNLDKYEDKKKVNFEADHRQLEFIGARDVASVRDDVDKKEALFNKNKEYIAESLSKRTVLRLEKLLENNPNGIWCTDLPKLYEDEYELTLEWEDFGFQRLSDFVSHLPKIFNMVGPYRSGDYRLFDAKKPLPDDNFQSHQKPTMASLYDIYGDNDNDDALPKYISRDIKQSLCPDDVLGINETVGHISVTRFIPEMNADGKKIINSIGVHVVEAFSPSFFWVQLSKYKRKFDDMMENLGNFYDENSSKYKIPLIILEEGLNIACRYFGKWHRGVIKSITPSNSLVTVMFYDFGTLKSYRPEEVFFLHRRFGVLDAQAIPCGLCFVKPIKHDSDPHDAQSNEWPKVARNKFIQMAFKCEMWANIFKVDVHNNSMLIGLTDTSGDEDLHLEDYLLQNNLAEKTKTELVVNPNDLSLYVEDYGDFTSDDPEVQPTDNLNTSADLNMSSAQPSLENSIAILNSSLKSSISNQMASNWDLFSEKITQVLDQYDQSVNGVYVSLAAGDWESTATKCIKNSLHKVFVKLFYDAIHSEASGATPSGMDPKSSVYGTPLLTAKTNVFVPDTKTLSDDINGDTQTLRAQGSN